MCAGIKIVRGGQHPQVLAVLLVDSLDALCNDDLDSCAHLGVGRGLSARALSAPLSRDGCHEPAGLDQALLDRKCIPGLETKVGEETQLFIVVVADVGGRDLVSGDLIPEG